MNTCVPGRKNEILAASPALADVRAAIASANEGDKVIILAGEATWAEQLVVGEEESSVRKA